MPTSVGLKPIPPDGRPAVEMIENTLGVANDTVTGQSSQGHDYLDPDDMALKLKRAEVLDKTLEADIGETRTSSLTYSFRLLYTSNTPYGTC